MNKRANWSPKDHEQCSAVFERALASNNDSGNRARALTREIKRRAARGERFALDLEEEALAIGMLRLFTRWQKSLYPRVRVARNGNSPTRPGIVGVRKRSREGVYLHDQQPWGSMTWAQLRDVIDRLTINVKAYEADILIATKLLTLRKRVPNAGCPDAALKALNSNLADFLAEG